MLPYKRHTKRFSDKNCNNNNNANSARFECEITRSLYELNPVDDVTETCTYRLYIMPALVSVICYCNGLTGDFVHDDKFAVLWNKDVIAAASSWSLSKVLTNDFWGTPLSTNTSHKSYRPLTILSFRANFLLTGLNTTFYHVVNVALHGLCTILVTHVALNQVFTETEMRRSSGATLHRTHDSESESATPRTRTGKCDASIFPGSGRGSAAWLVGLLFAVHPIHTEAVTGIVGRADLLSCCFFLLSMIVYHKSACDHTDYRRHIGFYLVSVVMVTAAMLSKEHGVMVLFVNSACDVIRTWSAPKIKKGSIGGCYRRVFGNVITFVMLFYFRWWIMAGQLPVFSETENPVSFNPSFKTRFLTFVYLPVFNAKLLLYPSTLAYDWQFDSIPLLTTWCDGRNMTSLVFYVTMFLLTSRSLFFKTTATAPLQIGLLLLCLPFLPAANLFFYVGFVVAERILYISSIGYCVLVVYGLRVLLRKSSSSGKHWLLLCFFCLVIAPSILKTITRNEVWRNREALFRSGVQALPSNAKMHYNYANFLRDVQLSDEAIRYYEEAIRLYPRYTTAYNNLGLMLNDTTRAEACYRKAIELNPRHASAHHNLGVLLMNREDYEQGLAALTTAANLMPRYASSLANAYTRIGRKPMAVSVLKMALDLGEDDIDIYTGYISLQMEMGNYDEAETYTDEVLSKDTESVTHLINKAKILQATNRTVQAEHVIDRAGAVVDKTETLIELSNYYFHLGRHAAALHLLDKARTIEPNNELLLHNYGTNLAALKRYDEAESMFRQVLQTRHDHKDSLKSLSSMYGTLKRHEEGIVVLNRLLHILESRPSTKSAEYAEALAIKASHERELKHYDDAIRTYTRLIEIETDNIPAKINLGALYHLKGFLDEAEAKYAAAERLDPGNKLVKNNMAKLASLRKRQRTV